MIGQYDIHPANQDMIHSHPECLKLPVQSHFRLFILRLLCSYEQVYLAEEDRHDKNKEYAVDRRRCNCDAGLRGICEPGSQGAGEGCRLNGTDHAAEAASQRADQCRVRYLGGRQCHGHRGPLGIVGKPPLIRSISGLSDTQEELCLAKRAFTPGGLEKNTSDLPTLVSRLNCPLPINPLSGCSQIVLTLKKQP